MSVQVEIISGTIGSNFDAAVASASAAGYYISGDPWISGSYEYQYIEIYINDPYNYNPDLLSRNFRNQMGITNTYPTSSALSLYEFYSIYKHF